MKVRAGAADRLSPGGRPETGRQRPPLFRALGADEPPDEIELDGRSWRRVETFKHDSWAATALYRTGKGRAAVCKFNRREPIFGLPMRWLGRALARREAAMLRRLADVPLVPDPLGRVRRQGRVLPNAVAHVFVPGHPLREGQRVDDAFFPALEGLLAELHGRGIAYVDLHKRENVLVGDDGRPYLIDFQISVCLLAVWPLTVLLRILQRSDDYHLAKHYARYRPDQCGYGPATIAMRRPWWIRLHRAFAVPLRQSRRQLLVWLGIRRDDGRSATEAFPEQAVREEPLVSIPFPTVRSRDSQPAVEPMRRAA